MRLVDTHAHLDEESFDAERTEILQRAAQQGVVAIVTIGTLLSTSQRAVELAVRHREIFAAVGVHPNYVTQASDADWIAISRLAREQRVVGIGETGLDLYWKTVPLDLQREWFRRHLALSRELGKPVCIHCREAEEPVLEELRRAAAEGPLRGVMHSFAGSLETARECVGMGLSISFSGILTYKKSAALRELARQIPHDRLLVETDSPYLSPQPVRGKRNEPAHVRMTAETLAEVLGLDLEQVGELTTINANRLFALSLA
ncbi:MAG TPA: hydrolase TatD [Planctomycetaceae bacterium]|nr:hydrolase TatD [Planctomycetaceae bacterium]